MPLRLLQPPSPAWRRCVSSTPVGGRGRQFALRRGIFPSRFCRCRKTGTTCGVGQFALSRRFFGAASCFPSGRSKSRRLKQTIFSNAAKTTIFSNAANLTIVPIKWIYKIYETLIKKKKNLLWHVLLDIDIADDILNVIVLRWAKKMRQCR